MNRLDWIRKLQIEIHQCKKDKNWKRLREAKIELSDMIVGKSNVILHSNANTRIP